MFFLIVQKVQLSFLVADVIIRAIAWENMTISRRILFTSCIFSRCFEDASSNIITTDTKPTEKFE